MKKEEKSSALTEIATIKKDLMMMRIKSSSGELVVAKEYKNKKKAIARLFTKINSNKKVAKA
jgi:ribosomal protein L29